MKKSDRYALFADPGAEWRGKPFWSWNGELREEEIRRQIRVMKQMGLGGYFMHSRAGLITEYLGDEWFRLIHAGADEGEKCGMEAWLYDEDRWPSGSAGGKVTEDIRCRMKSLVLTEQDPSAFMWTDDVIACYIAKIDGINLYDYLPLTRDTAVSESEKTGADKPGSWKVLSFRIVPDAPSSNYNGNTYIDTMSREATSRFIELTHEQYKKNCGDRFGSSIKGFFTDEPHRGHAMDDLKKENGTVTCSMCWTDDFFEEFRSRCGYDAKAVLPELFYRKDGERFAPIKHDWFDVADNLFLERFAMPINDWCNENGLSFTGHVLHEDSLTNQSVPHGSLMRFYEYMAIPGVDVLSEDNYCYWIVKQLSSAARQLGKKQLLSELYGCTGWQMNFQSYKAVGDWQALFGINLRCPHLSWYTMEGESKRDYPASILHQSPWYPYFNDLESYFARFGIFMSEGKPVCDLLVLNPVESVWSQSYLGWANWIFPDKNAQDVLRLEQHYTDLFHILTGNHIDFDYGEEQMLERHYSVSKDADGTPLLHLGEMSYRAVVISGMETIRPSTLRILNEFASAGGKLIFPGKVPSYINAVKDDAPAALAKKYGICVPFEENALIGELTGFSPITISLPDGSPAKNVFTQLRDYGDGIGFVLLNTDRENSTPVLTVKIASSKPLHVEQWLFEDGRRLNASGITSYANGFLSLSVSLPAAGTKAFLLTDETDTSLDLMPAEGKPMEEVTIRGNFRYENTEPNVCVLDFARFRLDSGDWSGEAEILKLDRMVRDRVGIERRGGEMLQPWFAKLHDKKVYGELELEYSFEIEKMPEGKVFLAGERPEKMHYAVNGVPLNAEGINEFWIDDCFKKLPIPLTALKNGKNTITVKCEFMRTTNLEALYLVGEFGVRITGSHTCIITEKPASIHTGNYSESALPFYTGELTYLLTPDMYQGKLHIAQDERIMLAPESFGGALIRVQAEDEKEIRLDWTPYEADVTNAVRAGKIIRVTVVGTRRNLFGPLHFAPVHAASYSPNSFVTEGERWTNDYAFIDSGLTGIILRKYHE